MSKELSEGFRENQIVGEWLQGHDDPGADGMPLSRGVSMGYMPPLRARRMLKKSGDDMLVRGTAPLPKKKKKNTAEMTEFTWS